MKKYGLVLILIFYFFNLKSQVLGTKKVESPSDFVEKIKKAHHFERFHSNEAVSFEIEMTFGGKPTTKATMTTLTSSGKIRFVTSDDKTLIWDGKKTWLYPLSSDYKQARFDIFMFHYFFMIPFKVSDKGTNWSVLEDKTFDYNEYARAKLTFQQGTGDSPDDWYIVHRNKATNYLEALAYIVTYGGRARNEAEKKPGGITYSDWTSVGGVMFPTTWKFWNYSDEKGFFNQKGTVKISNIRFVKASKELFEIPQGSKEVSF